MDENDNIEFLTLGIKGSDNRADVGLPGGNIEEINDMQEKPELTATIRELREEAEK